MGLALLFSRQPPVVLERNSFSVGVGRVEALLRIKLHSWCEWRPLHPQLQQVLPLLQILPSSSLCSTASDAWVSGLSQALLLLVHWPLSSGCDTLLACHCPPLCSGSVTLQTCCHLLSPCCQEKERAGSMTLVLKTLNSSQIPESCNTGEKRREATGKAFTVPLSLLPSLPVSLLLSNHKTPTALM